MSRKYLCMSLETIQQNQYPKEIIIEGKVNNVTFQEGQTSHKLRIYYPTKFCVKTIPVLDNYALIVFDDDNTMKNWADIMRNPI